MLLKCLHWSTAQRTILPSANVPLLSHAQPVIERAQHNIATTPSSEQFAQLVVTTPSSDVHVDDDIDYVNATASGQWLK